jgi:hypothetical protein
VALMSLFGFVGKINLSSCKMRLGFEVDRPDTELALYVRLVHPPVHICSAPKLLLHRPKDLNRSLVV